MSARTQPQDEALLIACLGRRETSAFAQLYDRYAPRVYGYALKLLRDQQAAEAMVQAAFLALWHRPDSVDLEQVTVCEWLLTLVHRDASVWYRTARTARLARPT